MVTLIVNSHDDNYCVEIDDTISKDGVWLENGAYNSTFIHYDNLQEVIAVLMHIRVQQLQSGRVQQGQEQDQAKRATAALLRLTEE